MSWRQANGEASNDSPLVLFAQFRAKWQVRFFPIGRLPPVTPLRKVKARLGFDEEMGFLDLPKKISPHLSHSAIRRQFEDGSVEWPFCLCCAAAALVIGGCCGGLQVAEPMASFVPWYRKGQAMNAAGKQVAIFVRAGARNWFAVAGLGLFLARGVAHGQSLPSRQAGQAYRQFCVKCHGADGTGNAVREQFPKIPDFTKTRWQMARSNPQLLVSIREGKGTMMPPFGDRLSNKQTSDLVAFVRAFDKSKSTSRDSTNQGESFLNSLPLSAPPGAKSSFLPKIQGESTVPVRTFLGACVHVHRPGTLMPLVSIPSISRSLISFQELQHAPSIQKMA